MFGAHRIALVVTVAAGGVFSAASSQAALIAADDFSSYSVNANLSGLNGGTGFSGGYAVGAATIGYLNNVRNNAPAAGLSYTGYTADGGNFANLASGYGGPSFNYVQRTVNVAGAFSAYSDGTRVGKDGTTLYGSFLYHNVAGGQFFLQGVANDIFNLPTTGSDSLYVFRIVFGTGNADTFTYFSDPNLATFNGTSGGMTSSGDYSFQTVGFIAPNSTNEVRFDNLKLGSTLADVVPIVVPEPSSLALLGLSGAMWLRRRRR